MTKQLSQSDGNVFQSSITQSNKSSKNFDAKKNHFSFLLRATRKTRDQPRSLVMVPRTLQPQTKSRQQLATYAPSRCGNGPELEQQKRYLSYYSIYSIPNFSNLAKISVSDLINEYSTKGETNSKGEKRIYCCRNPNAGFMTLKFLPIFLIFKYF